MKPPRISDENWTIHKSGVRGEGGAWMYDLQGKTLPPLAPTPPPPPRAEVQLHPDYNPLYSYSNTQYYAPPPQPVVGYDQYYGQAPQPAAGYGGDQYYGQPPQPAVGYGGDQYYGQPNYAPAPQQNVGYGGQPNYAPAPQQNVGYGGQPNYAPAPQPYAGYGAEVVVEDKFNPYDLNDYGYQSAYVTGPLQPSQGNIPKPMLDYKAPSPPPPPAAPAEPPKDDPFSSHIFENPPSEIKTDYRWMDKTNSNDENRGNSIFQKTTHTPKILTFSLIILLQLLVF